MFGTFSTITKRQSVLDHLMQIQIMFILVPDTVKRSLSHGAVPRTEIHFPNVLNSNPKADFDVTAVSYSSSRGGNFGRYELHRLPQYETRPCCVPCQTSTLTNEDHIFPQGVLDHSVFASHMSPSEQGFVELKTCNTVSDEGMGLGKVGDTREGDELENLESPRTFGSSTSSSTKGDTVNQDPVKHTIMHISRSQITNPWGSASYSDLITMAITSTPENMMTLSQIYGWIVKNVPYFNDKGSYLSVQGWKVSRLPIHHQTIFLFYLPCYQTFMSLHRPTKW